MSTAQKMRFSIEDFLSKYDKICSFLRIWSHLLKKFLTENFIFCAVEDLHWFCGKLTFIDGGVYMHFNGGVGSRVTSSLLMLLYI